MKKIYFLLLIALFQQSLELNWNPLSTLGNSVWSSRDYLFHLIFPKKDIAYYSKKLDKKVEELNNRNYNPKGYKICPNYLACFGKKWENPVPSQTNRPFKFYRTRLDAIKQFISDEVAKCMHEKNKDMENEFKRLSAEIGLNSVIVTKPIAERAMVLCRGTVCPLGVCVAAGKCTGVMDANKAGRMKVILEKSADAFTPCAKDVLNRQY